MTTTLIPGSLSWTFRIHIIARSTAPLSTGRFKLYWLWAMATFQPPQMKRWCLPYAGWSLEASSIPLLSVTWPRYFQIKTLGNHTLEIRFRRSHSSARRVLLIGNCLSRWGMRSIIRLIKTTFGMTNKKYLKNYQPPLNVRSLWRCISELLRK